MVALTSLIEITQGYRYAKGSAANIVSGIRQFLFFTAYFNLVPIPTSESSVVLFLEFMARTAGYKHIKHLLSCVCYLHNALNYSFTTYSFQIRSTLQGLKRRLAKVPFQVLPITPTILRHIFKLLDMNKLDDLALWCSFLCAFYGLLRKANTVPNPSQKDYQCLLRRHVKVDVSANMVYLYMGYSKTNNFGTRDVVIPIPGNSDPALDPVRHLTKLFSQVNAATDSPAFSYSKNRYITYSSFTSKLKNLLLRAGYSPELYSGHSFRRGGATFLYNCGGSTLIIQASGDWASHCFIKYLYLTEAQRLSAQILIRSGIENPA